MQGLYSLHPINDPLLELILSKTKLEFDTVRDELLKHQEVHKEELLHCDQCDYTTQFTTELEGHAKTHGAKLSASQNLILSENVSLKDKNKSSLTAMKG